VVFRRAPPRLPSTEADALNARILERVNRSGAAFLSHTVLRGRTCIRVSVGNLKTTREHVRGVWDALQEAARKEEGPET